MKNPPVEAELFLSDL